MSDMEKLKNWLETYPGFGRLRCLRVDLTDRDGDNAGLYPSGLVEVRRRTDLLGAVTVENQYNFNLHFVLEMALEDPEAGAQNAQWLLNLQNWIQDESMAGRVPVFGDRTTRVTARDGRLTDADPEGVAVYSVRLRVEFIKRMDAAF